MMSWMMATRMVVGGLVVGFTPLVARRFGPGTAAVLMLIPVITLASLVATAQSDGRAAVASVALRGIPSVITVVSFLGFVWVALRLGQSIPISLGLGIFGWAVAAIALVSIH